jgi:hypothetical protein
MTHAHVVGEGLWDGEGGGAEFAQVDAVFVFGLAVRRESGAVSEAHPAVHTSGKQTHTRIRRIQY